MTTKLTVANQKGGAGKTSFAVMLCLALAEKGHKVLAVDCDPQGGMSNAIKIFNDGIIHDMLMGKEFWPIKSTDENGIDIDVIPSSYELDKLYVTVDHLAFKRTLKGIELDYDYIVFDTPPTMQGITRAAIHYSDRIFIPSEVSKNAIGPTLYTLQCLEELDKKGEVIFIDNFGKSTTRYKKELREEYLQKLNGQFAGTIRRTDTTKKIVAGDIALTPAKIEEYLQPLLDIVGV